MKDCPMAERGFPETLFFAQLLCFTFDSQYWRKKPFFRPDIST
jgi:hypothetical protein